MVALWLKSMVAFELKGVVISDLKTIEAHDEEAYHARPEKMGHISQFHGPRKLFTEAGQLNRELKYIIIIVNICVFIV